MTGLVPVIHVVRKPERFRSARNGAAWMAGKPGHDGTGGFSALILSAYATRAPPRELAEYS
jgi:hypothetical protein